TLSSERPEFKWAMKPYPASAPHSRDGRGATGRPASSPARFAAAPRKRERKAEPTRAGRTTPFSCNSGARIRASPLRAFLLPEPAPPGVPAVAGEVEDVDPGPDRLAVALRRLPGRHRAAMGDPHVPLAGERHARHEDLHRLQVGQQILQAVSRAEGIPE